MNWRLRPGQAAIYGDGLVIDDAADGRVVLKCLDPEDGEIAVVVNGHPVLKFGPDCDDDSLVTRALYALAVTVDGYLGRGR